MKKLLLSITCMLFASITMAQNVAYAPTEQKYTAAELNALTVDTYIAIKNLSATNNYWYVGNTGKAPYSKAEFTNDAVFVWSPVEAGVAGSYYLMKLDGTYMQATAPKDFGTKDNAAIFTATAPRAEDGTFNGDGDSQAYINGNNDANLVRFTTNGKWINVQNGDNGTPTYNNGKGGWTIHYAYAVEEAGVNYKITYNYILNGETVATQNEEVAEGEDYPDFYVPNVRLGIVPATAKPDGIVDGEETIDIELKIDDSLLPFKYVENGTPTTWYYAQLHSNNKKYIIPNNEGQLTWSVTELPEDETDADNYTWGFVGNVIDGFVMVNRAGKAVVAGDIATIADEGTAYIAMPARVDSEAGFCLLNGSEYINGQDGLVKKWWDNDQGSIIILTEREIITTAIENVETEAENAEIYDLTGRKVENITKAGIYIVNGCKVLIK